MNTLKSIFCQHNFVFKDKKTDRMSDGNILVINIFQCEKCGKNKESLTIDNRMKMYGTSKDGSSTYN
jgi:hypothetical protein